jgi:hypothetical protein
MSLLGAELFLLCVETFLMCDEALLLCDEQVPAASTEAVARTAKATRTDPKACILIPDSFAKMVCGLLFASQVLFNTRLNSPPEAGWIQETGYSVIFSGGLFAGVHERQMAW